MAINATILLRDFIGVAPVGEDAEPIEQINKSCSLLNSNVKMVEPGEPGADGTSGAIARASRTVGVNFQLRGDL